MAIIDSLDLTFLTDVSKDEAIELLRQVRLQRRIPQKRAPKVNAKVTVKNAVKSINADQASEILKILGG